MTDHPDIVERLSADADRRYQYALVLSNMREPLKDNDEGRTVVRLREAAAEITRLRAEAEALRKALLAIVDRDFTFFDGYVDRYTITYGEIQQARAAIAATKEQQA